MVKPDSHVAQLNKEPFEVALKSLDRRQLAHDVFQSFLGVDARPETTKLDLNSSPGNAVTWLTLLCLKKVRKKFYEVLAKPRSSMLNPSQGQRMDRYIKMGPKCFYLL